VYGRPEYADVVKELKVQLVQLKQAIGDTDEAYPELAERFRSA